ncbi:MAG: hypothetical protein ACE5KU_05700 [Nitrososphaerales archaeon]
MSSRLLPIIVLITTVWLIIFAGSYAIFQLIVPLPDFYPGLEGRILTSIFKAGISGLLVLFWLYLMWTLRNFYVKRRILAKPEGE